MVKGLLLCFLWIGSISVCSGQDQGAEKIRAKFDRGKYYAGIRLADKYISDRPSPTFFLLRAEGLNEIGEFARAERDARQAMPSENAEDRKLAALQLGIAAMETGRSDSALYWLNEALGSSNDSEALIRLGRMEMVKGDHRSALQKFDRVLSKAPENVAALLERGAAQALLGDTAAARADLDRAIELAPRDPVAWNSRGFHLHASKGDHKKAIADYDRAIKFDPNYSFAFNNRGWSYFQLGEEEKARKNIKIAARKRPNNPFVHRNLGLIELAAGDTASACIDFKRALELNFTELHGSEISELVKLHCTGATSPTVKPEVPRSNAPSDPPRTTSPVRSNAP